MKNDNPRNNHATRFQKGRSGNPNGRPKGAKDRTRTLEEIMNTRISVTENGKKKDITKLEAAFTQLVNKAVGGDLRAIKMLQEVYSRLPLSREELSPPRGAITEEEAAKRYHEALKKAAPNE